MMLQERRPWIGEDQQAQRQHADQVLLLVDDEDVVDVRDVGGTAADGIDRVVDGRLGRERDELALHDAAGRLLVVAQQVADVGREPRRDGLQEPLDLLARQLRQEVGGVVGFERRDERPQARVGERVEERVPRLVTEEAQDRRGALRLELREESRADVVLFDRVEQLGGVGRVQALHRVLHLLLVPHFRERDEVISGFGGRHGHERSRQMNPDRLAQDFGRYSSRTDPLSSFVEIPMLGDACGAIVTPSSWSTTRARRATSSATI